MAKWGDIQAEVFRQDIAELETSLNAARGAQKESYQRQIADLRKQLNEIESQRSSAERGVSKKAQQKRTLEQLKQKFGNKTHTAIANESATSRHHGDEAPSREHTVQSEGNDEYTHLLRRAEDFAAARMLRDRKGQQNALGADLVWPRLKAVEEGMARFKAHKSSEPIDMQAPGSKRLARIALQNVEEVLLTLNMTRYSLRLRRKVLWTVLTAPRSKVRFMPAQVRVSAALAIPFCVASEPFIRFKAFRIYRKYHAMRRKLQYQYTLDGRL